VYCNIIHVPVYHEYICLYQIDITLSHINITYYPINITHYQGRIQGFKLGGGAHLKKLRRAEGGAKIVGVFRVKNHDFTPCRTNIIMNTYEYQYNFEVSHQSP
jgi:hypothetical protein